MLACARHGATPSFAIPSPRSRSTYLGGRGKMQLDSKPRRVVEHFDAGTVKAGHGGDEAEAETIARRAAAALEAIEAPEHVQMLVRGDARSVVRNGDHGSTIIAADGDGHLTGRAPVLDGVVDEVGHGVEQEVAVGADEDRLAVHDPDMSALVLCRGVEQLHDLGGDLGEIDGTERCRAIGCLDLRDAGERREHAQDIVEIGDGGADQRLVPLRLAPPDRCLFQPAAHAHQRRPQVVGDVVSDLLHLAHQPLDALQHGIEIAGELIPLVVRSAQRNAAAEAAFHDGAAGGVDGFDPPHGAPRDADAGHRRQQEHEQRR